MEISNRHANCQMLIANCEMPINTKYMESESSFFFANCQMPIELPNEPNANCQMLIVNCQLLMESESRD